MILSKVFPEVQRCTYNCYVQRVVGETYNTCTVHVRTFVCTVPVSAYQTDYADQKSPALSF